MLHIIDDHTRKMIECMETIIDAIMLLQETVFDVNKRTTFVKPSSTAATRENSSELTPTTSNDGNKSSIMRLAKSLGLSRDQISTELLPSLDLSDDGYYSINDAIPKIREMMVMNNDSRESGDGNNEERETNEELSGDDDTGAAIIPADKTQLDTIIGSRVRTVFEDGNEHEGTITTVHYRVRYDDGDTETFLSEAEAYEALACNLDYMIGPSLSVGATDFRCSMLEIFSGESLVLSGSLHLLRTPSVLLFGSI